MTIAKNVLLILATLTSSQYVSAIAVAGDAVPTASRKHTAYEQFFIPAQDAFRNEDYETAERLLKQFEQSDYRFDPEEIGPCGEEGNFEQLKELLKIARQCRADGVPRKHWKDFDTAKKEVSAILRRGAVDELGEYVNCFPENTMSFESFCTFDGLMNGRKHLQNLFDNIRFKSSLLQYAEWRFVGGSWALYPRIKDRLVCDIAIVGTAPLVIVDRDRQGRIVITGYTVCHLSKDKTR